MQPMLDFEFRFVAGHWFSLPVKQFWGEPADIIVFMKVEPINGTPGEPKRISHRLRTGQIVPEGTRGDLNFPSAVSVGLGEYRTAWVIRDSKGRSCGGVSKFKAKLSSRERNVDLTLAPGEIVDTAMYLFRREEAIDRPHLRSDRRLKIFVSLDILGRRGRVTRPRMFHLLPHIAALRQLSRSPNFNQFSVVVFSFEDQRVIARQDYAPGVDFAPFSRVIQQLRPDQVDYRDLLRGSEMAFFAEMLGRELQGSQRPDGVVFLGHDLQFGKQLPRELRDSYRGLGATAAFFDGSRYAWTGAMGNLVKAMDGKEYRLRRPSDLARAISAFEQRVQGARPQ